METKILNILIALNIVIGISYARLALDEADLRRPFDQDLYANVLDPVACAAQLRNVTRNPLLLLRFLDAGIRLPRGVLEFNMVDLGNYYQCLGIDETLGDDMKIQGKYCMIELPTSQDLEWLQVSERWLEDSTRTFLKDEEMQRKMENVNMRVYQARVAQGLKGIRSEAIGLPAMVFRLAVCIPKPCSTQDLLSTLPINVTEIGFTLHEEYCRLPNDKPWVAADTVAVVVFSVIGFLTLLSTCYDLYHTLVLKRDPKSANAIGTSFSVYTNTRRILTFTSSKGTLECLDGIRVISMMWIIIGHAVMMHPLTQNVEDLFNWFTSTEPLWLSTAPIAVDTFFMMAGVLLVYTSAGKMTGRQLIRRLPVFYLNRLLRLFPALAAIVLLEASVFHRISDGPIWGLVARNAQRCRTFWWSTLLHVQNHVNPLDMCIPHSWYVAIDVQLYIVSPLVLVWVLGGSRRAAAAIALAASLLAVLAGSTAFNFVMELPGGTVAINRWEEMNDFMKYYYFNTLTRAAPFFVGMIFGYLLHLCRGKKVIMNLITVHVLWVLTLGAFLIPFYTTYLIKDLDWDNQIVDSLINSFQRSLWALALGWLVFACVHGYGGPIDWFLSLQVWKLPSRLSYAMYLYHYSLMFIFGDRALAPIHFSVTNIIIDFITQFSLTLMVAFIVGVVIEAPFSTLVKLMLERGSKTAKKPIENPLARKNSRVDQERNGTNGTSPE